MKRPLLAAALCVVAISAMRLEMGAADQTRPGCVSIETLDASEMLLVTGQIYQKDEQSVYLKSITISDASAIEQSAGNHRHEMNSSTNKNQIAEYLICETEGAVELPLGSWVMVSGAFMPFSVASNPGEFDGAVYYRTLGIGGKLRKTTILAVGEGNWPVREGLYQLKCYCKKRLYAIFQEKEAAIMSALLLGDKKGLDSEVKDMYQRNGILHIFSISSLHITIIGMGIYRLLRKVGIHVVPSAAAGSILLILYGCMTGFSVSACRAIGMYILRMLAKAVGRTYDLLTALGVMAAVMVIQNPYYLQNSGFILSFTSVLGIGVVFPALVPEKIQEVEKQKVEKQIQFISQLMESIRSAVFASLSITLTTLPVQLWFYYEIPMYSVFLNLFVIPLVKPMMIIGLLTLLPGLGWLSGIDHLILKSYEYLCVCVEQLPFHTWNPGCPQIWQIVIYYILLLGVVAARAYGKSQGVGQGRGQGVGQGRGRGVGQGRGRGVGQGRGRGVGQGRGRGVGQGRGQVGGQGRVQDKGQGRVQDKGQGRVQNKVQGRGQGRGKFRDGRNGNQEEGTGKEINKNRNWKKAINGISVVVLGIAVLLLGARPRGTDSVTFLDVGQGDCILVRTASGQTYLFDCGSSSRSGVGEYVLIPYLKYCGIHKIDGVFLSHPDADHVNGALELLASGGERGITVRQLLLPAIEKGAREEQLGKLQQAAEEASTQKSKIQVGYLSAGDTWDCGNVTFTCLHPGAEYSGSDANAYSECFYVEFPEWTLLLTGDVGGRGEAALLEELAARRIQGITVLKAAHHGSRNASSEAFLRLAAPKLTVISCGRDNRYGHPHKELLERLEQTDTYIMQTAQSGAITVTFRKGKLTVYSVFSE